MKGKVTGIAKEMNIITHGQKSEQVVSLAVRWQYNNSELTLCKGDYK